ncbi:bifunctional riboflavin kinase/FAD synthetase [Tengunoibacter tsumagoiensis]|uniref:Riboflavin biosynthesis protein n=1 Tax=Tengunoibacter tsumagoiensis TaxID=2014871 RepID=A0A402A323_9CHLR|nr:bifunctional riboflavin kinase/FAD synthetase [Tengunoibacter tsumagoiensis]GCE13445.1 riboflavin biosynthesis protein [Tengunoibacter tsumagoiensis]
MNNNTMEYQTTLANNEPIAITIGNFDGIHLGHQQLLHKLRLQAQELHCRPVLVTFAPHTIIVVRPDIQAQFLTTLNEKLALAARYGQVADHIVITFTPEVAAMSAEEFMDALTQRFSIRGLIVGENFSLGHNRKGDVSFLKQYGQDHHIQVLGIPLEEAAEARISSTRIRTLVTEGQISEANALLGHPVIVDGVVSHGDKRGRLLGFPTANILPEPHKLLPANGVYAVYCSLHDGRAWRVEHDVSTYQGVVNIGVRPTFNGKERLVEAHLLDVDLDLYDQHLKIEFIERLRGEQRFSGVDALKAQIASDIQSARQILEIRRVSH